jgi:hypothetical protein
MLGAAFVACSHPGGGGGVFTGSAGTTGSGGNSFPTGTAGTGSGFGGNVGTTGSAGTTGSGGDGIPTGTAGTTGAGGDVSPTGTAGNVGTPGTAGTMGGSGVAGTSGGAGASGSAGDSGTAGTTGTGGSGPSGPNLIENGDFSNGATNWHTENGTGNVNAGAYCVSNPGGSTLVGYAAPTGTMVSLSGGYKLTFQASGAGTVHIKVGMAVSPYSADYEGNSAVSSSPQTFTHMFTANDNNAGIAFTFMNAGTSTVCLDNIALVSN